ncbi:BatA domain-containing protein [Flavobacterium sp. SUN052]|uniref:BatA domain-containing protein n=1 Tax=Flavobacterium sp. SUN052 TaxID=3002441 RepID=UPI00237D3A34|nr:BatA domain-containing protein [Flavobacterium sp. SUN052]MEC4004950.1 BatA domain-containing protein [Flavobacterium sp. SUN052]
MQFKHPEILYFLFLLVIPILVHLFQLRKFKTEYFTNVKFLKELAIQTRKSSKLKKYLLLITRLLLLAFLIIAFAQPFFKAKDSKNATNELYIVLDNSFSMQAKGQKGELLKRAVQDLLEHTPENANFSLITCSDNYWNTDIKSIQKELQNLKYSASPFQLDNLLSKIKAHKSAFNKDIVVITDGVGLQPNQVKGINDDENLYFILPEAEKKDNIAIDSVYINQTMENFYEIAVKMDAFGEDFKDIPIALYNKNKLIAKTLVNFETKNKTINFTIPKEDFHGYVSISDNSLDYDNTYYFSISKPQKSNVISIGEPEKSGFLSRIYTSNEFNYANYSLQSLDYNLLDKQDAIILNELKDIPQALQTTLKAFAEKGGNVVVIPSGESSISNLNTFLSNFGGIQFKSLENSEKMVTKINFSHPLFSSVFEKKVDNFQYPNTKTSFEISNSAPMVLGYSDQTSFLSAIQNSVGSIYVFAAPINKVNSNFQNSPIIVPTFYNMGQNAQKAGITALIIGENKPFIIETLLGKDEIVNVKNYKESFIPVQQILNSKVKLTFNDNPKEAGNFNVFNNNQPIENISFNYNRTESNLSNVNSDVASDFKEINSVDSIFDTLQANRADNQLWKWFIIFTLLFIALEVLIQKFVK